MSSTRAVLSSVAAGALALACIGAEPAQANPIAAGFDYFRSNDGAGNSLGASVDLGAFGLGIVPLRGVALPSLPFPFDPALIGLGVDTIVERLQNIDPFDPPGGVGTVDIELVALSLVSIDPIDLTALGGPFVGLFGELHTIIDKHGLFPGLPQPAGLTPSIGKMEIRHEFGPLPTDNFGGTFDSMFGSPGDLNVPLGLQGLLTPGGGVIATAVFTVPGGNPANPLDVLFSTLAPRLTIWSQNSTWQHTSFTDFQVTGITHDCSFPECHPVIAVPAPAAPALLGIAGFVLAGRRRR